MLGHIIATAFHAVFPIVGLILLGYILKRVGFLGEAFIKNGSKLVFHVALPCMLFVNVYDIGTLGDIPWSFVAYCALVICLLFCVGFVMSLAGTKVPERRGVIWQCAFRSNFAIIGMPLAAALGGAEAEAVAAIVSALAIPMFNIMAVVALSVFVSGNDRQRPTLRSFVKSILHNPLIIGVALGLLCIGIRALQQKILGEVVFSLKTHGKPLYTVLANLKAMTTPLALVVLGGQCEFSAVKGMFREIAIGTVGRIVLAPALAIGGALVMERVGLITCGAGELAALIALCGSPVAVSSAIMATEMKNDSQLATQLVVWTSAGSVLTIFLTVCILMATGLLAV